MPSIALEQGDVIVGVDTHKDAHVAVAIDGLGGIVTEAKVIVASPEGYLALLTWAKSLGQIHAFGVEGCGSYGSGLAKFLRRHDCKVHEVARPPRKSLRRLVGKSDSIDAEHAARTVLSGIGMATPKLANGQVEAIRLLKIARDTAVKAHSTTSHHSQGGSCLPLQTSFGASSKLLRTTKLIVACAKLDVTGQHGRSERRDTPRTLTSSAAVA